jgi:hypothetical protein
MADMRDEIGYLKEQEAIMSKVSRNEICHLVTGLL